MMGDGLAIIPSWAVDEEGGIIPPSAFAVKTHDPARLAAMMEDVEFRVGNIEDCLARLFGRT